MQLPIICPTTITTLPDFSFAPKRQEDKRKVVKLEPNQCKQSLSDVPLLNDPFREAATTNPSDLDPKIWNDVAATMDEYDDFIRGHLEQRIALFFQMTIVCHKMPFYFESSGEAEEQLGAASGFQLHGKKHTYQAAHSSTLPTLYAYPLDEWEAYLDKMNDSETAGKPECFVYLKDSQMSKWQNATNALPTVVNQMDSFLDWQGKSGENPREDRLRQTAIKIVNSVASDQFDPVEGTKEFIHSLHDRIQYCLTRKPDHPVLTKYLEIAVDYLNQMDDEGFFDDLLNIRMENETDRSEILRKVVYKKRFEIIRASQITDGRIKKVVHDAALAIGEPNAERLQMALILASTGQERITFQKLFCKTGTFFDENYEIFLKSNLAQAEKECQKFKKVNTSEDYQKSKKHLAIATKALADFQEFKPTMLDIKRFTRDNEKAVKKVLSKIHMELWQLRRSEEIFRAGMLQDLIKRVNGFTQREFVGIFKKLHPDEPMSQPMVSRLIQPVRAPRKQGYSSPECQRRKILNVEKGKMCADVLNIDPGVFFPCLFNSLIT